MKKCRLTAEQKAQVRKCLQKYGRCTERQYSATVEYITRQLNHRKWDHRPAYGIGFLNEQDILRMGFDYKRG